MAQTKKLNIVLIVMTIVQIIMDVLFSLFVTMTVFSFIQKQEAVPQPLSGLIAILTFLMYSAVYFVFAIYPGVVKKKNAFSKTMEKHSFSFLVINLFIVIAINSLNSNTFYDKDNLKDLVNIEWAIYGITIALFTIWEAIITSKNEESEDPEKYIGLERLEHIRNIKLKKVLNSSAVFTAIIISINTIAIIAFTLLMYIINQSDNNLVVKVSIISFYLCINSLVITFVECLIPMFISKINFDSKHNDKKYEDDDLNRKVAFDEELSYRLKKLSLELDNQDDAEKMLSNFADELIKKRKDGQMKQIVDIAQKKISNIDKPIDNKKQDANEK